jgi:hypothetical protein
MRKAPLEQVNESVEHQQEPEFAPEVVALLEEDKVLNAGQHSIMDTWLALKAEAERHGYVAKLVLPFDMHNLEIEYTDPQGERTTIFSMLFPGGEVQTVHDGLQMHHEISNDMEDQTAAVRGSIERDAKGKGKELGPPLPQLAPEVAVKLEHNKTDAASGHSMIDEGTSEPLSREDRLANITKLIHERDARGFTLDSDAGKTVEQRAEEWLAADEWMDENWDSRLNIMGG